MEFVTEDSKRVLFRLDRKQVYEMFDEYKNGNEDMYYELRDLIKNAWEFKFYEDIFIYAAEHGHPEAYLLLMDQFRYDISKTFKYSYKAWSNDSMTLNEYIKFLYSNECVNETISTTIFAIFLFVIIPMIVFCLAGSIIAGIVAFALILFLIYIS